MHTRFSFLFFLSRSVVVKIFMLVALSSRCHLNNRSSRYSVRLSYDQTTCCSIIRHGTIRTRTAAAAAACLHRNITGSSTNQNRGGEGESSHSSSGKLMKQKRLQQQQQLPPNPPNNNINTHIFFVQAKSKYIYIHKGFHTESSEVNVVEILMYCIIDRSIYCIIMSGFTFRGSI